jgi:hypothetical protein
MKYLRFLFLLGAIILFFFGLYNWLWLDQIAYAALFVALASIGYSVYLHMTKSDRSG